MSVLRYLHSQGCLTKEGEGRGVDQLAAWKMMVPKFSSDTPFCYPLLPYLPYLKVGDLLYSDYVHSNH